MTHPSATWALIPVKAPGLGKTRLAGALSPVERERLVEAMLAHVLGVVTPMVARTLLVGARRPGAAQRFEHIADEAEGLNPALRHALNDVARRREPPSRLIVVPADLPGLERRDLAQLLEVLPGTVGIAPDRHGLGTNALSLPLPEAAGFRFCFGTDSAFLHRRETEMLGLSVVTISATGLEKDIDEPCDLADAGHLFSPAA